MRGTAMSEQAEGGHERSGPVTPIPARRVIGLDLGISSAHHAVVVDETGRIVLRRRLRPLTSELMQSNRPDRRGCRSRCSSPAAVTLSCG